LILHNPQNGSGYGVVRDDGSFKTMGLSFELGGVVDSVSPSTRENLVKNILRFSGVNLPPKDFSLLEPS